MAKKSKSKKSSIELKNLTRELKQATEQLKKIADEKKKHLPGQRELQLQLQPVVEAIKKVNERAMKMTPGMEAFLHSKPSFWGSERYYEQIEHEVQKVIH